MKRRLIKMLSFVTVLIIVASIFNVNVFAAVEGVTEVFKAGVDGNTKNAEWMDAETGIISIPLGEEFSENAGGNKEDHGVYHLYSDVAEGDEYYVHWVLKVEENDDAEGMVVVSQDPWYLSEYAAKGEGEVASGETVEEGLNPDTTKDFYYEDLNPGKWTVASTGFTVMNEETAHVQHRLHYKNNAAVQVKYLIVTDSKLPELSCDPETGEIDGITNDKAFTVATKAPTEEPTEDPTTEPTEAPVATTAKAVTPTAKTTATAPKGDADGLSTGAIAGIVIGAVAVIVIIIAVVMNKKKKK